MKEGDGTRAPSEERRSVLFKHVLRSAWRRVLSDAALAPKSSAGGEMSNAHLNWASIAASPGKTTLRSLAGQ